MKYTVTTSNYNYNEHELPALKALGFTFTQATGLDSRYKNKNRIEGYFYIQGYGTVELNTLEDLARFGDVWGQIILDGYDIEIYDCDRE